MKHNIVLYSTTALFLIGCSAKSNFYQLKPKAHSTYTQNSTIKKENILAIANVKIAPYLDKPQVITRINDTQIQLNELDRWAGDIDKNIQQVLTKNLSAKLPRYSVLSKPLQEPINERYTLYVSIDRFDGDNNGHIVLNGHWSLTDTKNQTFIKGKKFSYTKEITTPQLISIINAQSQLLDTLSDDISKNI